MLPSDQPTFWSAFDHLVATCPLHIDRAAGTPHPRYPDQIYPVDYGYLEGTTSSDGAGIDLFCGARLHEPGANKMLVGIVCTVDPGKRDCEIKLLIDCTQDEIQAISTFLTEFGLPFLIVQR